MALGTRMSTTGFDQSRLGTRLGFDRISLDHPRPQGRAVVPWTHGTGVQENLQ